MYVEDEPGCLDETFSKSFYQLPQERKLSHHIQSISDGNVEATASKRFFEERKCKQAPRPPPLPRVLIVCTLFRQKTLWR